MVTKTKTKYVNKNKFKKKRKNHLIGGVENPASPTTGAVESGENPTGQSASNPTGVLGQVSPSSSLMASQSSANQSSASQSGKSTLSKNSSPSAASQSENSKSSSSISSFKTAALNTFKSAEKNFKKFSSNASSELSSLTNSFKSIGKSEPKEPLISGIPVTQLKSELESLKSLSIDNINLNVSNNEKDLNKKVNDICNEISSKALLLELNKQFYSNLNKFVRAAPKNNEKIYGEKILGKNKNLNFMLFNKLIHGKTDNWPPIEQRDSLNSELSIKGKNMMSKFFGSNNNKSKKSNNESNTSEKKGGKIIIKRKRKFLKKK